MGRVIPAGNNRRGPASLYSWTPTQTSHPGDRLRWAIITTATTSGSTSTEIRVRPAATISRRTVSDDGVDRRGFLRCMAWAGTATVWGMAGGIPKSFAMSRLPFLTDTERKSIFFAQISDSHIGFAKEANKDVTATLREAVDKLNALPQAPRVRAAHRRHHAARQAGGVRHGERSAEGHQDGPRLLRARRARRRDRQRRLIPRSATARARRAAAGTASITRACTSSASSTCSNLKAGGLGSLGAEQIAWLKKDVARLASSTPIVLFAHVPLWTVYPEWGWGTDDSEQALASAQALRVGDGAQRPHPPDHAEGGRQHVVPHGDVDGLSAAGAWNGTGPGSDEGRAGEAQERAWHRRT